MKFTAQPGRGDEVVELLLDAAGALRDVPGCELYVVNRSVAEPGVIWVTELWLNQEALDASLEQLRSDGGQAQIDRVTDLLAEPPERIELEPLGGVGYLAGGSGYTHVNLLEDVEDMAQRFGLSESGESRFATRPLGAHRVGLSHQRLRPGARQQFGHRHQHSEEVLLVLRGTGRIKIDDEIRDVRTLDAVRLAPASTRALEAGREGMEFVVFGPHLRGDAVMDPTFWPAETS